VNLLFNSKSFLFQINLADLGYDFPALIDYTTNKIQTGDLSLITIKLFLYINKDFSPFFDISVIDGSTSIMSIFITCKVYRNSQSGFDNELNFTLAYVNSKKENDCMKRQTKAMIVVKKHFSETDLHVRSFLKHISFIRTQSFVTHDFPPVSTRNKYWRAIKVLL